MDLSAAMKDEGTSRIAARHDVSDGKEPNKHAMQMGRLSQAAALGWIASTYLLLLAALWITARLAPIRF
jgi:hypothetical protein